jgi:hypothetical protein
MLTKLEILTSSKKTRLQQSELALNFVDVVTNDDSRSQWPCGLRRGSTATRLLSMRARTPPRAKLSVFFKCCVLSGPIARPEES